jgi:hypothetical protein
VREAEQKDALARHGDAGGIARRAHDHADDQGVRGPRDAHAPCGGGAHARAP